jgi:hypothetical protein
MLNTVPIRCTIVSRGLQLVGIRAERTRRLRERRLREHLQNYEGA